MEDNLNLKCNCKDYSALKPNRDSISKRIKESKQIKKKLQIISNSGNNQLYRCNFCGQLWQGSYAWNWGGNEYLFKIPLVEITEWLTEQFVQPDELLIYFTSLDQYKERLNNIESDSGCAVGGCGKKAIKSSLYCLAHHIEQLQAVGILPKKPKGRLFATYDGKNSDEKV